MTMCTDSAATSNSSKDPPGARTSGEIAESSRAGQTSDPAVAHALLCAWFDIEQADQPNFFEWHDREHMAERVLIPGFRLGRRFQALDRQNHFLILYDVTSLSVLASQAYLDKHLHRTPWSQLTRPVFKNLQLVYVHPVANAKIGDGAFVYTLQLTVKDAIRLTETVLGFIGWISRQNGILAAYIGRYAESIEAEPKSASYVLIVEGISLWNLTAFTEKQEFKDYWHTVGAVANGRSEAFVLQACVRPEICVPR